MKKLMVINVLPEEYFQDCHIKGSINVPLAVLGPYAENLDKTITIVVYCASYMCSASRNAWHLLHDMEFENVMAYEGGMAEWYGQGLPGEGTCGKDYLKQRHEKPEKTGKDADIKEIGANELYAMMNEYKLMK